MTIYLLLTAFTVSMDSLFCGLSLGLTSKKRLSIVLTICTVVFLMCLTVNYAGNFLSPLLTEKTVCFGGAILILTGLLGIKDTEKEQMLSNNELPFSSSVLSGFAVGIDGALANLSIALMGIKSFLVPVTIALMHAITVYLGIELANLPFWKKVSFTKIIASFLLVALGYYKLSGALI